MSTATHTAVAGYLLPAIFDAFDQALKDAGALKLAAGAMEDYLSRRKEQGGRFTLAEAAACVEQAVQCCAELGLLLQDRVIQVLVLHFSHTRMPVGHIEGAEKSAELQMGIYTVSNIPFNLNRSSRR